MAGEIKEALVIYRRVFEYLKKVSKVTLSKEFTE